jgi:hypothetical protein
VGEQGRAASSERETRKSSCFVFDFLLTGTDDSTPPRSSSLHHHCTTHDPARVTATGQPQGHRQSSSRESQVSRRGDNLNSLPSSNSSLHPTDTYHHLAPPSSS